LEVYMVQELAQRRADERFNLGEKQEAALLSSIQAMVIRDRLVAPKGMKFVLELTESTTGGGKDVAVTGLLMRYGDEEKTFKIHRHALSQLAGKVEFPIAYLNKLSNGNVWRGELLTHNLNTLFARTRFGREENPRFLHRIVGDELRGFLSRRFNRHLASLPLLRAFVESVRTNQGRPIEAAITDLRWSLKCYLPMVFEAFPGQYICVGVTQSHSDFGAGKHVISQSIWDPLRDTRTVLEGVGKVHLGSVIEDSDIELSDETAVKEVEAQCAAAADTVNKFLSEESVNKALRAVKIAHEEKIEWSELKSALKGILYEKELASVETLLNSPDIVDLPPVGKTSSGDPLPTKWWASSMLSKLANSQEDERKMELQALAGKWLG
jgi:hypothetical protein